LNQTPTTFSLGLPLAFFLSSSLGLLELLPFSDGQPVLGVVVPFSHIPIVLTPARTR
jgi:hypothetical protein